jgi:putative phosphoribosyl transferase
MLSSESSQVVHIPADSVVLEGVLDVPQGAHAVVIFAHGSGSSRHSKRNKYVAEVLREVNLATLLFDLLTKEEDLIYENRFDILLLAKRLSSVTRWVKKQPQTRNLRIGYFGASTGAAAALVAAAEPNSEIGAIVSRGGRPDLAENFLNVKKEMRIIPGASHLFEEPGALEQVARLAAEWFNSHLLATRE